MDKKKKRISDFTDFATDFAKKWNTDTPTGIDLPNYRDEKDEREDVFKELEDEREEQEEEITESYREKTIVFKGKRNPGLTLTITTSQDGRIKTIDNPAKFRFPFSIGEYLNKNIETWANNNNFLIDGKDVGPDKKIFGIKTKDIPQGHEFRHLFPNKFK